MNNQKTKETKEEAPLKLEIKRVRTGVRAGGWCGFSMK
jgi:hypothetical protein